MLRRNSPSLAGRWLGSMGSQEAARELLENTDLKQQRQALIQMKPHRAAALLEVQSLDHTKHLVPTSPSMSVHAASG